MYWPKAEDTRQLPTPDWMFDECENAISSDARLSDGDPQIVSVMSPRLIEFSGVIWQHPIALLVTQSKLIADRKRGIGKKVAQWNRWDFYEYKVGQWRGSGPGYAVTLSHRTDGMIAFSFETPDEAEKLGRYFAEG